MNTSLGYLGATFCNRCSEAKLRAAGSRESGPLRRLRRVRRARAAHRERQAARQHPDRLVRPAVLDGPGKRRHEAGAARRLLRCPARAAPGPTTPASGARTRSRAATPPTTTPWCCSTTNRRASRARPPTCNRIALETAHNRVAAAIAEVEYGPDGPRAARRRRPQHPRACARLPGPDHGLRALGRPLSDRDSRRRRRHAVALVAHDPDHSLWAARRRDGATVALASIIDGKWDGQLLPAPRRRRRPRRSAVRTGP